MRQITGAPSSRRSLKTQLTNWGFTVTAVKDSSVTASSVASASIVVVSATAVATNVNTKLRDVTVPVVVLQSSLFDDFQMTGTTSSDFGTSTNQTSAGGFGRAIVCAIYPADPAGGPATPERSPFSLTPPVSDA